MESEPFALRKWYMDGTDQVGRSFIGYWSSLSWRGLSVVWQSIATYAPGARPTRRWSVHKSRPPSRHGSSLLWESPPIAASVEMESSRPRIQQQLWRDDATCAAVDWYCEAPVAVMRARLDEKVFQGVGYAERIELTVPPWRLPIDELRWGRWCDETATRSVVWIEWRGPEPRRWVFLDGALVEASVSEVMVSGASFHLKLTEPVGLEHRSLADALVGLTPVLNVLPQSVRDMQERKWFSNGLLVADDGLSASGHAIHEVVVFR